MARRPDRSTRAPSAAICAVCSPPRTHAPMGNIGIVVEDIAATIEFFRALGLA
jgi:hypothetical protein